MHRGALEEAGEKIVMTQSQLDSVIGRVGVQIAGAVGAGMKISEIAELTGLSRQKIYELRDRYRGDLEDLNMRALAQLGASGALTISQVSSQLSVVEPRVASAIEELERGGLVKPLMSSYEGGETVTYFKITPPGAEALERWMLDPEKEPARVTVYVAIGMDEKEGLRDVAINFFGPEWFAIIEPGTVRDQRDPELAFHVAAENSEEAVARARSRVQELRKVAKLEPRPVAITALLPAGPLHMTFGHRKSWMTEGLGKD